MRLRRGGLDIFYIDESNDSCIYVVTAVAIPFLRQTGNHWEIVWDDYFGYAKDWRGWIRDHLHIPCSKELHGNKLLSGRGRYNRGKHSLARDKARRIYERVLSKMDFIPSFSVMSVAVKRATPIYGATKLDLAMHLLFQRMRSQCDSRATNAITFFDEGHPEYRRLYRRAQVYLPTGSQIGQWPGGRKSKNLPLSMFTKDGNIKESRHCLFTQMADLIAYAAFLKVKGEMKRLSDWQKALDHDQLYDAIPRRILNTNASNKAPRDAIVRV